jgi:predicted nucleic acid-binding protein
MDNTAIVDACVFIEHWRSKNKDDSLLTKLHRQKRKLYVSAIAKYEVLAGANDDDMHKWHRLFDNVTVLAFDDVTIDFAQMIYRQLKRENKLINTTDILIAASAMVDDIPLATLNRKHFERIPDLRMV